MKIKQQLFSNNTTIGTKTPKIHSWFSTQIQVNSNQIWHNFVDPLSPFSKKHVKFLWTEEHTLHFNTIKYKIAASTENIHYKPKLDVPVKCDASRSGLGAVIEQITPE